MSDLIVTLNFKELMAYVTDVNKLVRFSKELVEEVKLLDELRFINIDDHFKLAQAVNNVVSQGNVLWDNYPKGNKDVSNLRQDNE